MTLATSWHEAREARMWPQSDPNHTGCTRTVRPAIIPTLGPLYLMERDELIAKLTTVEQEYLVLHRELGKLEARLKLQEDAERSWALWYAKVGVLPTVASVLLAFVSIAANLDTSEQSKRIVEAVRKIESVVPSRN